MDTNVKNIGNVIYEAALVTVAATGIRYASKSLGLKDRPIEFKPKSIAMLALDIGVATYVVDKLQTSQTIPSKVFT